MATTEDVHLHIHLHDDLEDKIDEVLYLVRRLLTKEMLIEMDLSELTNEVATNTDVVNSAVILIAGLADQLEAAAGDPVAVQQLAASLRTNNEALASAVAANTPANPPTEATNPPA